MTAFPASVITLRDDCSHSTRKGVNAEADVKMRMLPLLFIRPQSFYVNTDSLLWSSQLALQYLSEFFEISYHIL